MDPVNKGGRISTFVIFSSGQSSNGNNTDLRVTLHRGERAGMNKNGTVAERRKSVPTESTNSASAVNSLIPRYKRNSLDESGRTEKLGSFIPVSQIKRSAASGVCRHGNAVGCVPRDQQQSCVSYPLWQQPLHVRSETKSGDSIRTEIRRLGNAGEVLSTEVQGQKPHQRPSNVCISHQIHQKQRRFSLQNSSTIGHPPTNTFLVAQNGNHMTQNTTATGRRVSDSKITPLEASNFFRERSLSDCNRVARMRVLARLVLRSPAPFCDRDLDTPRPRRLEPLTARSVTEAGLGQTTPTDVSVSAASSVSRCSEGESASDDFFHMAREHEKIRCKRESSAWESSLDCRTVSPLEASPRYERSISSISESCCCRPRPLIGRKAKELLLFGGERITS